jgi:hypothetical protein
MLALRFPALGVSGVCWEICQTWIPKEWSTNVNIHPCQFKMQPEMSHLKKTKTIILINHHGAWSATLDPSPHLC